MTALITIFNIFVISVSLYISVISLLTLEHILFVPNVTKIYITVVIYMLLVVVVSSSRKKKS